MEIAEIIKIEREQRDMTQEDLAKILGITRDSISLWEIGKRIPGTHYLKILCDTFEISADYLLGRTDELGGVAIPSPTVPALAGDEKRLLDMFERMSHPMKIRALAYCEGLLSADPKRASKD